MPALFYDDVSNTSNLQRKCRPHFYKANLFHDAHMPHRVNKHQNSRILCLNRNDSSMNMCVSQVAHT